MNRKPFLHIGERKKTKSGKWVIAKNEDIKIDTFALNIASKVYKKLPWYVLFGKENIAEIIEQAVKSEVEQIIEMDKD